MKSMDSDSYSGSELSIHSGNGDELSIRDSFVYLNENEQNENSFENSNEQISQVTEQNDLDEREQNGKKIESKISYLGEMLLHPTKYPPEWWKYFGAYDPLKTYTNENINYKNEKYFIPPKIPEFYINSIYKPVVIGTQTDAYSKLERPENEVREDFTAATIKTNDPYSVLYNTLIIDLKCIDNVKDISNNREICEKLIKTFPKKGFRMKNYFRTLCQMYISKNYALMEAMIYYKKMRESDTNVGLEKDQVAILTSDINELWGKIVYAAAVIRVREASYKLKCELEYKLEQKRKLLKLLKLQRERIINHCFEYIEKDNKANENENENENINEKQREDDYKRKIELDELDETNIVNENRIKFSQKKTYDFNSNEYSNFFQTLNASDQQEQIQEDKLARLLTSNMERPMFNIRDDVFAIKNTILLPNNKNVSDEVLLNSLKTSMVSNSFYDGELPKNSYNEPLVK